MTALALGHRELTAHPAAYHGATCAQVYVRRHVHDTAGEVLYAMPDGCAACGRQWFAEDEHTIMGYCGDCWPGNAILLDVTDNTEAVAATYPQPVRHRAPSARGRAQVPDDTVDRLARGEMTINQVRREAGLPPFTVDDIPDMFGATASADPYICPECGSLADLWHSVKCSQYSRRM